MEPKFTSKPWLEKYPLTVNRQQQQHDLGLHSHDFKELVIILGGKATHFSGKESYPIMAGDCYMVEEAHGYRDSDHLSLVNILFIPERMTLPWNEARKLPGYHAFFALEPKFRKLHHFKSCLRLSPEQLERCSSIIDDMEKELQSGQPGYEFISGAFFMELVGLLARAYARMEEPAHVSLLGLSEVISHLERNYSQEIRMADLVKMACVSESALLREFKRATGHAPIDFLLRLRLRHAAELLRHETTPITEIALRVGFNDSNYFTRQFGRFMEMSPRAYRRTKKIF